MRRYSSSLKKAMVRRFYLRPGYLWRRLRSVKSWPELAGQLHEGKADFCLAQFFEIHTLFSFSYEGFVNSAATI